ncbi:flavodoxin [Breznakibacter xylanolyticus]|nr:flavodoxin [Breznakibacter xylanolyticus]
MTMKSTGIIYGSSMGNTRFVAEKIAKRLPGTKATSAKTMTREAIEAFDNLLIGTSTWGVGMFQDDFHQFSKILEQSDLTGKTVALFGLGDQMNYPDSFCDGIGIIYDLLEKKGCQIVGFWPTDDYNFSESKAVREGQFVGLALDEDNEPDMTDYRIKKWLSQISQEL